MFEPDAFWSDTARFEGVIPWMYKDTLGVPTIGVGFAMPEPDDLLQFKWDSLSEAKADYQDLLELPPAKPATFYRPHMRCRLSEDEIREAFFRIARSLIKQIEVKWDLHNQPLNCARVLFSLAYQVGPAGLARFKNLHRAVMAKDWSKAAQECSVSAAGKARNEWRAEMFK